jgi:hemoglobin
MSQPDSNMHEGAQMDTPARREQITLEIMKRTGIDEDMIRRLVHSFYAVARNDGLLGPIFEANVADWNFHFDQMCSFWSSVALLSGCYHGKPFEKHLPLPLEARHFDRWLKIFEDIANQVCPEPAARHFIERADRITDNMRTGMKRRTSGAVSPR